MRILLSSGFTPNRNSGAAGSLISIGEAYQRLGHDVDWLWMNYPRRSRVLDESFLIPFKQAAAVRDYLLGKPDFDVVVISQPYAFHAFESLAPKYPHTLFVNRTHGWEARCIVCQNEFDWNPSSKWHRRLMRSLAQRFRNYMCRRTATVAHGVIAACRQDAEWIRTHYGLAAERVAHIPYGVATDAFPPPPFRDDSTGPMRLIYAGQFLERKGSRILEQVLPGLAAEFLDSRLTFIVPEDQVELVSRAFAPSWGERLIVHSWMSQPELYRQFAEHDVLLFPSLFEGFGKVVVEAMAMGCIPVGFDEAVMRDLGDSSILSCAKGDRIAFERLLRRVLRREVDLATRVKLAVEQARRRRWDTAAEEGTNFFINLARHWSMTMPHAR